MALIPLKVSNGVPESLKEVGKLINKIYWEQSCGSRCSEYLSEIEAEETRMLFQLNFGPFNRVTGEPLIEGIKAFPGQGNYPEGVTGKELIAFLEKHPELEDEIKSPYMVVVRDNDGFRAIPYSEKFSLLLKQMNKILSSTHTGNESLDKYLHARANELLIDKYEEGDNLWLKINKGLSAYIGPCIVEDPLLGTKMAYGEVVFTIDTEWTEWGKRVSAFLPEIQRRLPVQELQSTRAGKYPGLQVADLKFAAGVLRVPPVANFVILPPEIPELSKKIFFKNIMFQKYEKTISKVGEKFIHGWKTDKKGWFSFVIIHDIFHYIGTFKTPGGGITREKPGKKRYFILEEIKADASAVYFAGLLSRRGMISKDVDNFWKNYLAHLVYYAARRERAAISEINYLLLEGGIRLRNDGKIEILEDFRKALGSMLKKSLEAQISGGKNELLGYQKLPFGFEETLKEYSDFDFYMENDIK